MERRESTVSGSPTNIGTDSPVSGVLPQVIDMSIERSIVRGGGGGSGGTEGIVKKKRGRPRKYGSERTMPVSLSPSHYFSPSLDYSAMRGRERPPGSGSRQALASLGNFNKSEWVANSAGANFTPHVLIINAGEDLAAKIFSFSQMSPRSTCILTANGAVSIVTIQQSCSSGGYLTYEGHFEILSLTGSFSFIDTGGVRSRTGGLSVALAGPDGRVVGGGLASLLIAASPIQVVVGSFMPNNEKVLKKNRYVGPSIDSTVPSVVGVVTAARPISQATPDDDNITSPISALPEENSTSSAHNPNSNSFENVGWQAGSQSTSNHKPSPDINARLRSE